MRKNLTANELRSLQDEVREISDGFDLLGDHVVITDPEGNIIYANKAVQEHTGFSLVDIVGKNPGDLWGGIMDKKFYESMWHRIKIEKCPFVGEVKNRNRDGEIYDQELRIFPVLDDNGEVKFFIGMEPDITVRKVFEGHTQQYVEELERFTKHLEGRAMLVGELEKRVAELKEQLRLKAS